MSQTDTPCKLTIGNENYDVMVIAVVDSNFSTDIEPTSNLAEDFYQIDKTL